MAPDPYTTLGIRRSASDEEVRAAYRRMVQLHHPDHNHGSAESARRFEEVQEAYSRIREERESSARRRGTSARTAPRSEAPPPPRDPEVETRMADLERQVREAAQRAQREAEKIRRQARQAAREAAADRPDRPGRASDEELGYVETDDSFSKILADARDEITHRFSEAREHPVVKRVSDLIDGLDDLASKLDRDRRSRRR